MNRLSRALAVAGCLAAGLGVGCGKSKPGSPTTPTGAASQALHVISTPVNYAEVGEDLKYQAVLSKPGAAVWSLTSAPIGATIDQGGSLHWTPTADQGGAQDIAVHAALAGESVDQTVHVTAASTVLQASAQVDPASTNGALIAVDAPLSPIQGTAVQIDPGALPPGGSVAVTIGLMDHAPVPAAAKVAGVSPSDLRPVDFGPTGLAFQVPVKVHLPVTSAVLLKGRPEIQTYDYDTGKWQKVTVVSVDPDHGFVVGEIKHFSTYVVTPPSTVFNLQLGLGASGSSCAAALLVRPTLAATFEQIPASSVNGYKGQGATVADVLAGLAVGEALQVYTRVRAQAVAATGEQTAWVLASATRLPDGKLKVNVTTDSNGNSFLTTPPELDAADSEVAAWLSGGRVDLVFGGLGALDGGATADAEVSFYDVLGTDADRAPPQSANPFGSDSVTQAMLLPMANVDDDCDGAPNQWDPTPQGTPPPLLSGLPPSPVHTVVGSPAGFKIAANQNGVTFTWTASDPSVAVTTAVGGTVATAAPSLPGLFHLDVVGSNGTSSSRLRWDLVADPVSVQSANTPPHVFIGASATVVHPGEKVVLNAYGKDAEQAQLTFAWYADNAASLSAQLGSSVVFTATTPGDYKIGCIANDGIVNSTPATVVVSVISPMTDRPPSPPVVSPTSVVLQHAAGAPVTVVLQASSSDPDGDPLTYDFQPDPSLPPSFTLTKAGAMASFTSAENGFYLFYVTAQDNRGATSGWTPVKIQVMPTLPPMPVDVDKDGYPAGIDCNDNDPTIHPGAKEICGDNIDQNCDGRDLGAADCDVDGDRFSVNQGDCDDNNPSISPGAIERCDGIDNNCNGVVDEGFGLGVDCSAGVGACRVAANTICNASFNGVVCGGTPGLPKPETCDGIDNDCDGQIDDVTGAAGGDVSNCGGCNVKCAAPANSVAACVKGGCATTCSPGWIDTDHNPDNGCECQLTNGGVEICDGIDNDCNGSIDDGASMIFYDGPTGSMGVGICAPGTRVCQGGKLTTQRAQQVPVPEICDGLDNDCNGKVDDGFDLTSDPRNCGACGVNCGGGKCANGACMGVVGLPDAGVGGTSGSDGGTVVGGGGGSTGAGPSMLAICASATGSFCTDLAFDPANCGGCGKVCAAGAACSGGTCVDPTTACPSPKLLCKDNVDPNKIYCTDPMNDPGNCGGCGLRCPTGVCQAGVCQGGSGTTGGVDGGTSGGGTGTGDGGTSTMPIVCDAVKPIACQLNDNTWYCTDLKSDSANCGGCGKACPAGVACTGGQCAGGAVACTAPLSSCGSICTTLSDDPGNCGTCGTACAGGVCSAAMCQAPGGGKFGDPCKANTDCAVGTFCMDEKRFGWIGGACTAACDASRPCGNGQTCVVIGIEYGGFGTCRQSCGTDADCGNGGRGYLCTAGTCAPDCRTSADVCMNGQMCDATGHCITGTGLVCPQPMVTCSTATQTPYCTDVTQDPMNCGGCGKVCPGVCNGGVCQPSGVNLGTGLAACPGTNGAPVCANLYNDPSNCGACGITCQSGTYCQGGVCAAPPACPQATCVDAASGKRYCTDTAGDPGNCGACGVVCPGGTYCGAGACVPGTQPINCPAPAVMCADPTNTKVFCTRTDADPSNCGACGNVCPAGQGCANAVCVPGGTVPDGGTIGTCADPVAKPCPNATGSGYYCVYPQSDPGNCGGCGIACPSAICQNYACVPVGGAPDGGVANCTGSTKPCQTPNGTFFCANIVSDPGNCGGCGVICPANQYCNNAACTPNQTITCTDPAVPCKDPNGLLICVDLRADNNNCGACGKVCPANMHCAQSVCVTG